MNDTSETTIVNAIGKLFHPCGTYMILRRIRKNVFIACRKPEPPWQVYPQSHIIHVRGGYVLEEYIEDHPIKMTKRSANGNNKGANNDNNPIPMDTLQTRSIELQNVQS